MILWDKTEEQFGYNRDTTIGSHKIVVCCDVCKTELVRIFMSYKQKVKKNGEFRCHSCATKSAKFKAGCSKRAKKLWQNPEYINNNLAIVRSDEYREKKKIESKQRWQGEEFRAKMMTEEARLIRQQASSVAAKENWKQPEYRNKLIRSISTRMVWQWKKADYREHLKLIQQENTTKLWEQGVFDDCFDDEFCGKMKAINNEILSRPDVLNKLSAASSQNWENEEYRNAVIAGYKKRCEDPAFIAAISARSIEKLKNPDVLELISISSLQCWDNEEYRAAVIGGNKMKWQDLEYRAKMAVIRAAQPRVSSIQTLLYSILDDLNVRYYREYLDKPADKECQIGPWNFDCVVPTATKLLLIECQGEYWHSLKENSARDKAKASYITNNLSGKYELKYLWEHEFSCQDKIRETLKYWLGLSKQEQVDYDLNVVDIRLSPASDYRLLLGKYHYLPNAGRGGLAYGAYLGDVLIAVCVFSPLIRQNIDTCGLKPDECVELSRLCLHPNYRKKNFLSWFVSRFIRQICAKLIISYCDTTYNHDGAIYRACNFIQDKIVPADYWYVSQDGWVMHKRTLYGHAKKFKLTEAEFAGKFGYTKVFGKEKLRFIYSI